MAKNAKTTSGDPAPSPDRWTPPGSDEEFTFESIDAAPAWIDRGWASFDRGPALAVPAGDLYGDGPYHTKIARVGDKVVFIAAKGASPAKLDVITSEPDPKEGNVTKKPPQQSAAALEDMLKTGMLTMDDLGSDAKSQVAARSPNLSRMMEDRKGAPEPQNVSDVVKLD
jgi:hypothetical protein